VVGSKRSGARKNTFSATDGQTRARLGWARPHSWVILPFLHILASLALYHALILAWALSLFLACYPPFAFINTPTSFCAAIAARLRFRTQFARQSAPSKGPVCFGFDPQQTLLSRIPTLCSRSRSCVPSHRSTADDRPPAQPRKSASEITARQADDTEKHLPSSRRRSQFHDRSVSTYGRRVVSVVPSFSRHLRESPCVGAVPHNAASQHHHGTQSRANSFRIVSPFNSPVLTPFSVAGSTKSHVYLTTPNRS
jgi:hypothetical protein